jgi:alanine racemase
MSTRPTWADVSITKLLGNFEVIRSQVGRERAVMGIVKADAYGHGLPEVSLALSRAGVDWFGVTNADEGIQLRRLNITQPILLLTGFWEGEQSAITDYDLIPGIYTEDQLDTIEAWGARTQKKIRFHLKVNTGLGMLGLHWTEVETFIERYRKMKHVELEGLFEQFAASEDFTTRMTEEQMQRFASVENALAHVGIQPRFSHQANSAAIVSRPESWGNMVRPGGLLYGYHARIKLPENPPPGIVETLPVEAIMTFRTKVIAVKDRPAGTPLGYEGSYVTPRFSRIATLPAGYADGMNRRLSGKGKVLIRGQLAQIVGIISMDLTLVDVTEIPGLSVGDDAVIIGRQGDLVLTASDHARDAGTIPYDIFCGIGRRVPRRYQTI